MRGRKTKTKIDSWKGKISQVNLSNDVKVILL